LLALLGLDGMIAAGEGPAQFQGSVSGLWQAPLRLKINLSGTGLDAEAQGTAEPWAAQPKASVSLKARNVNLAPLFDLKPSDRLMQNISVTSRVSLLGSKLTFEDLDGAIAGSRLRGRVALTLDDEHNVEGEVGLDALDLAPAFALAIGAQGRDAAEPLGSGLLKGWRGRIAFQALRGQLPGGGELRPVSGSVRSDGQSLTFDAIKGGIGRGEATATIDARQTAGGIALNARLQLSAVDGTALHYRALKMPAGKTSMQMTLASQGRSASALTGAMSGSGTVTLESAAVGGLDPRAFDVAIRASDAGQATDDIRLRKIVEPVLADGALLVASAQIPFTIRDGRLRVGATTLDSDVARAVISGGYDIPADQADIRATVALAAVGQQASRPEIGVFAVGSPDALDRTVEGDRSRDPQAGFDRARRAAAGRYTSLDSAGHRATTDRGAKCSAKCSAARPATEAKSQCAASAGGAVRHERAAGHHCARCEPAGRAIAAADRSAPRSRRGAAAETKAASGADAAAGGTGAAGILGIMIRRMMIPR
jgi:large subunit ribosomal protein L24